MKLFKKILLTIIILGFGVYAGYSLTQTDSPLNSPDFSVADQAGKMVTAAYAKKKNIAKSVSALGRLEPQGEVIDVGVPEKGLIDRLLVKEGQWVKAGAKLAYLEIFSERLAEKDQIASQLNEAKGKLVAETEYGAALLKEAELRVKQMEEISPLKIKVREAKVRQFKAELENSKIELKRLEALKLDSTISTQELDRQTLVVRQSQERLNHAKAVLNELRKTGEVEHLLIKAQLNTTQARLARSQSLIQIESLSKKLDLAKARLERTIIRAPAKGEILKIHKRPGEQIGDDPILQMGNSKKMVAIAEVYETDIRYVRPGQKAVIKSPALPHPLNGVVEHIGRIIFKNDVLDVDPASDIDARVVEVKILLDTNKFVSGLTNLQVYVLISLK